MLGRCRILSRGPCANVQANRYLHSADLAVIEARGTTPVGRRVYWTLQCYRAADVADTVSSKHTVTQHPGPWPEYQLSMYGQSPETAKMQHGFGSPLVLG